MSEKQIKTNETAGEGREIIVIGYHIWGKGKTFKEARKKCMEGGSFGPKREYLVYDVAEGTMVDQLGNFVYEEKDKDNPPKLLRHMRYGRVVEVKKAETEEAAEKFEKPTLADA